MRRLALVVLVLSLGAALGCGKGQKVGSERLLEFKEQSGERLGARTPSPKETAQPLTVQQQTPRPARPVQTKAPTRFFDIALVADSPFYKPGNKVTVRVGVTVRVTNSDRTPERSKGRSFTDKNGAFHSGLLKPGQQWTWVFDRPAAYEVIDQGLNFATAYLEVVA